ncbi:hypothetical protein A2T98_11460 [Nodularia spumigena CENA596]|uniref:Uncharacterized protein n=1 Tax=Nodularia spumigena CENA596 TaxID=1819295 RepID=A0A166JH28_NODSP|nr:hypothetical protein A2T98_11460 [Nodularia spumigena CENA596]
MINLNIILPHFLLFTANLKKIFSGCFFGVAETKYEFKCRDVPWNVSTGVLTSSQIVFILQISNAVFFNLGLKRNEPQRRRGNRVMRVGGFFLQVLN